MHAPPPQAVFIPAHLPPYLETIRALFMEYRSEQDADACFPSFEAELAQLPGAYAPPGGALILVEWEGAPAACAALRPLEGDVCEMKRLYVRPAYRGHGLGRELVDRFLERARILGYREVRLDTLAQMSEARALYRSFGFEEIPPYGDNCAIPGVIFMSRAIDV